MTHRTNPQTEFARLFCLASAIILDEMPPPDETEADKRQRLERIATIIAADERTKVLRADPNADPITLRANAMYWRELADELHDLLKARQIVT